MKNIFTVMIISLRLGLQTENFFGILISTRLRLWIFYGCRSLTSWF